MARGARMKVALSFLLGVLYTCSWFFMFIAENRGIQSVCALIVIFGGVIIIGLSIGWLFENWEKVKYSRNK